MKIYHKYTGKLIFQGVNLQGANLRWANLQGTNLQGANLEGANLFGANLRWANLQGTNLQGAYLYRADLFGANLQGANLQEANLEGANLQEANLRWANLQGTNLQGTYLQGAHLQGAKLPKFQIPQTKSLIVWKKLSQGHIAKLRIPKRAKRTASLVGNKCRAERAFVEEIYDEKGNLLPKGTKAKSKHNPSFFYESGKEIFPDRYDDDIRVECTNGIHFFMTRKKAEIW